MKDPKRLIRGIVVALALVSVPGMVFLGLWQSISFQEVSNEVVRLEKEQRDWLEVNKRMIANLSIYSSPARIDRISKENLGLERMNGEPGISVIISGKGE